MDTGGSCTGWASTPLGAVIRVTWVGWETGWGEGTQGVSAAAHPPVSAPATYLRFPLGSATWQLKQKPWQV